MSKIEIILAAALGVGAAAFAVDKITAAKKKAKDEPIIPYDADCDKCKHKEYCQGLISKCLDGEIKLKYNDCDECIYQNCCESYLADQITCETCAISHYCDNCPNKTKSDNSDNTADNNDNVCENDSNKMSEYSKNYAKQLISGKNFAELMKSFVSSMCDDYIKQLTEDCSIVCRTGDE